MEALRNTPLASCCLSLTHLRGTGARPWWNAIPLIISGPHIGTPGVRRGPALFPYSVSPPLSPSSLDPAPQGPRAPLHMSCQTSPILGLESGPLKLSWPSTCFSPSRQKRASMHRVLSPPHVVPYPTLAAAESSYLFFKVHSEVTFSRMLQQMPSPPPRMFPWPILGCPALWSAPGTPIAPSSNVYSPFLPHL